MNIGVVGSREGWSNEDVCSRLNQLLPKKFITIVSGGAKGVDTFAKEWAKCYDIHYKEFPVTKEDWKKHGKSAGFKRNVDIANECDYLICFWNRDSVTEGCLHTVELCRNMNKPIFLIEENRGTDQNGYL